MSVYQFAFFAVALFATYIQTKSYAFQKAVADTPDDANLAAEYESLLRIRRVLSPTIAGLAALLVAAGTFVLGLAPLLPGALLTGVWVFAALGDIFIEGSYSTDDEAKKGRYYIVGMVLFIVFTFGLGAGLSANALLFHAVPAWQTAAAVGGSIVMGIVAYRTLDVRPDTRAIMLVYTVSVTTLLCGGLLSAVTGSVHLGYIGIAYFVSDWCVGLRDFGKNVPDLLRRHVLIVILILYYTIMLTSIDFALGGWR